jgi:hypothetical protein
MRTELRLSDFSDKQINIIHLVVDGAKARSWIILDKLASFSS